jgi:hypothetical protein
VCVAAIVDQIASECGKRTPEWAVRTTHDRMILSVISPLIRPIQGKFISSLTTAHNGRTVSLGQPGRRARNLPPMKSIH